MTGDPTIEESDKKEMVEFVQGILNRGIISNLEMKRVIMKFLIDGKILVVHAHSLVNKLLDGHI